MSETQSFEEASDTVRNSMHSGSVGGKAVQVLEKREFKKCPEGTYIAICVKTELVKEPDDAMYDPGATKIHHHWEVISDARTGEVITYIDETDPDKKPRRYKVFGKPMNITFGDRSALYKLMMELTGIPPLQDMQEEIHEYAGGLKKPVKVLTFDQEMIKFMKCEVKIKHEPLKTDPTRTKVVIASLDCTPAMRYQNWYALPPHSQKEPFADFEKAKAAFESQGQPASPMSAPPAQPMPPQPMPPQYQQQPQMQMPDPAPAWQQPAPHQQYPQQPGYMPPQPQYPQPTDRPMAPAPSPQFPQ